MIEPHRPSSDPTISALQSVNRLSQEGSFVLPDDQHDFFDYK
jgi:hypothetical protein